jgi:glycosyltransferase involved in cell wall biosynthesis
LISVIVPVLDGLPWLREQLEALSIQKCDEPWEVVVADNGSTDGSVELVLEWAKRWEAIRLIDASQRPGPAAARNIGVGDAKGDRLAFCDADDVVEAGWLAALSDGLNHADVVAGIFDFMEVSDESNKRRPKPAPMEHHVFLPAGLAANLAVRRCPFESVGGFAEELLVGEDIDLCWRLQLAGYAFDLTQRAIVQKRGREGLMDIFRTCFGYGASGPHLYRRHRAAGAGREFLTPVKTWAWLVVKIPRLRHRGFRRFWVSNLGVRVGRLFGSARHRVFFP